MSCARSRNDYLAARDARTLVCDFNAGEFPVGFECDVISVLGVLEYIVDVPAFLRRKSGGDSGSE